MFYKQAGENCFNGIKKAFTLAEVLITLGIIGIVAEMTIPTLTNNIQDQVFKTAYKKAYSTASQALLMANADDLFQPRTVWCVAAESVSNWNAFKSKFVVIKECDGSNYLNNCWAAGEQSFAAAYPPGVPGSDSTFFVDASGMQWVYSQCFYYLLDTNGLKKPNKFGKDRFMFTLTPDLSSEYALGGPVDKVWVPADFPNPEPNYCPSGKCYYNSWLFK